MIGRLRDLSHDERGLAALLWVLGFTSLLAFFAIVVESGFIFVARRDLQNAVDAGALAGALELFQSQAADPELDAVNAATGQTAKNVIALTSNQAWVTDGVYVTANAGKDSGGVFQGRLSFAREVQASATARAAAGRLPGPGSFCVGVDTPAWTAAKTVFTEPDPDVDITDVSFLPSPAFPPWLTELRLGAGSGSNAGYIDIDGGGANVAVRDCFANGSTTPLEVQEPTETGIATGPAIQGFQLRFDAAQTRPDGECVSWGAVRQSIIEARANPGAPWRCSPLESQATSLVLIPIVKEEFREEPGVTIVTVDDPFGPDAPYLLSFYWIDKDLTFDTSNPNNWKFISSGGQGQMIISGVFIFEHPTTLGAPPGAGSGGIVDCDPDLGSTLQCFVQLVE